MKRMLQQQSMEISIAIPMFILWIALIAIAVIMINKGKMRQKTAILILIISIAIGGILLGGLPNSVMPIQQIFLTVGGHSLLMLLVPMLIILGLLLLSTLVFGRMFCGYACPVGAIQELASKINFKSNLKEQKKVKYAVQTNQKWANITRWIFFALSGLITIVWSFAILQLVNPFIGFKFFTNPLAVVLLIPLISLVAVIGVSIFVYRPWCRYLCPFGALASITSRFSRNKYTRTEDCTECGLCEKICPTQEAFKDSSKGECYYCNRCVEICPQNAIVFKKAK